MTAPLPSTTNWSDFRPDSFLQLLAARGFVHLDEVMQPDTQVKEYLIMRQATERGTDTVDAWASTAGPGYYTSVAMMLHDCLAAHSSQKPRKQAVGCSPFIYSFFRGSMSKQITKCTLAIEFAPAWEHLRLIQIRCVDSTVPSDTLGCMSLLQRGPSVP